MFRLAAYFLLIEELIVYLAFIRFLFTSIQFQLIHFIFLIGMLTTWTLTLLSLHDFLSNPLKDQGKTLGPSLLNEENDEEKVRNETAKIKSRIELLKRLKHKKLSEVELAAHQDLKSLLNAGKKEISLRIDGLYLTMLQKPSWCFKCQVIRPPRTTHCPLCERCVVKRDHHCYVSGGCVGVDNFLRFIRVTGYVTICSFIVAFHIFCGYFRSQELRNSSTVIFDYALLINMGLAAIAVCGLGLLFIVSVRNAMRNVTGVENRNMYIENKNPFVLAKLKENLQESLGTSSIHHILFPERMHKLFEHQGLEI